MDDVFGDELCERLDDQVLSVAWHVLFDVVLDALDVVAMLGHRVRHVLEPVAVCGNEVLEFVS